MKPNQFGIFWGKRMNKNARRAAALVCTSAALAFLGTTQLTGVAFADGPDDVTSQTMEPDHADGCPPDPGYKFSAVQHKYKDMVSSVEGHKDETIGITITKGITVTKTITGTVAAEEGVIFANAKESVSGSLGNAITTQVAYSATWKVDRPIGYLHAGADEQSMHWEHGSYNGASKWIVGREGTAVFPYHVPTFWHTS
ncbi:hypothetical protein [Streptomyces sp. NPDC052107]|uniref:hypothetical protein n=1 Tax=Streptomyces sp. NPDC052107 TaxID=3155632 RepID=UPI00343F7F69